MSAATKATMSRSERTFLERIAADPGPGGCAATSLPRARRGATLKHLELVGLICYGPGGWYLTESGEAVLRAEASS